MIFHPSRIFRKSGLFWLIITAGIFPFLFALKIIIHLDTEALVIFITAAALWLRLCAFTLEYEKIAEEFSKSLIPPAVYIAALLVFVKLESITSLFQMFMIVFLLMFLFWLEFRILLSKKILRTAALWAVGAAGWTACSTLIIMRASPSAAGVVPCFAFFWIVFLIPAFRLKWWIKSLFLPFFSYTGLITGIMTVVYLTAPVERRQFLSMLPTLTPVFEILRLKNQRREYLHLNAGLWMAVAGAWVTRQYPGLPDVSPGWFLFCFFCGMAVFRIVSAVIDRIKAIRRNPLLPRAYGAAVFMFSVLIATFLYDQFAPCDPVVSQKDFRVLFKSKGPYDMLLDPGGRYLYAIIGEPDDCVAKIDTRGKEKPKIYKLPGKSQPQRLVYDAVRKRIAIANWGEKSVQFIALDTETLKPAAIIGYDNVPHGPVFITMDPDYRYYYLLGETKGTVAKIDAETFAVVERGASEMGIHYGLCFSPNRNSVFTSSWIGHFITELSADSLREKGRFPGSVINYTLECEPDRDVIYAANPLWSGITVYEADDDRDMKPTGALPAGMGVRDMQLDPRSETIVAGSYVQGTLDFIDIPTAHIAARLNPGSHIRGVYYDPPSGRVFVACKCGIMEMKKRFKNGNLTAPPAGEEQ